MIYYVYGAFIGRILTGMTGAYNATIAKVLIPENIDKLEFNSKIKKVLNK